jgi:hypothetical protein
VWRSGVWDKRCVLLQKPLPDRAIFEVGSNPPWSRVTRSSNGALQAAYPCFTVSRLMLLIGLNMLLSKHRATPGVGLAACWAEPFGTPNTDTLSGV